MKIGIIFNDGQIIQEVPQALQVSVFLFVRLDEAVHKCCKGDLPAAQASGLLQFFGPGDKVLEKI